MADQTGLPFGEAAQTDTPPPAQVADAQTPPPAQAETQTPPAETQTPPAEGQAAPAPPPSLRDMGKEYGLDLSTFKDDQEAMRAVLQAARERESVLQHYHTKAAELEAIKRAQQPAPPATQAEKPKWWNPPDYDPSWDALVTVNDQGEATLKQGAPPEVLGKYLARKQYERQFAQKLISDPAGTLSPLIEDLAAKKAEELVQRHLSGYQDRSYAQSFVAQNSSWLHEHDPQGNVIRDPITTQPVLSQHGRVFQGYVVAAEQMGVRDIRQQERYARDMLHRDVLLSQSSASQQNQNIKNNFLQGSRQANVTGTMRAPDLTGQQPPQNSKLSLAEALRAEFAANGITDKDFNEM